MSSRPTAHLKIASVPGEVFIDTAVDDFTLSLRTPLHGCDGAVPGRAALRVTALTTFADAHRRKPVLTSGDTSGSI
jgi:hypothetical protein